MATSQSRGGVDATTVATGAVAGAVAFLVGYGITYAIRGSEVLQQFQQGFAGGAGTTMSQLGIDPPSTMSLVGWVFYVGHNSNIEISVSAAGQSQTMSVGGSFSADPILMIAPAVLLILAGFAVAYVSDVSPRGYGLSLAGATVTAGYGVLAIVGVFLFSWSVSVSQGFVSADMTVRPALMTSILLVGLLYPAIFGGIGGTIAKFVKSDTGQPTGGAQRGGRGGGRQQGQQARQRQTNRSPQGAYGNQGQAGQQGGRGQANQGRNDQR